MTILTELNIQDTSNYFELKKLKNFTYVNNNCNLDVVKVSVKNSEVKEVYNHIVTRRSIRTEDLYNYIQNKIEFIDFIANHTNNIEQYTIFYSEYYKQLTHIDNTKEAIIEEVLYELEQYKIDTDSINIDFDNTKLRFTYSNTEFIVYLLDSDIKVNTNSDIKIKLNNFSTSLNTEYDSDIISILFALKSDYLKTYLFDNLSNIILLTEHLNHFSTTNNYKYSTLEAVKENVEVISKQDKIDGIFSEYYKTFLTDYKNSKLYLQYEKLSRSQTRVTILSESNIETNSLISLRFKGINKDLSEIIKTVSMLYQMFKV